MTKVHNRVQAGQRRRELRGGMPRAQGALWSRLRNRQIEGVEFRRQFSIEPYIVDFYSPSIKFAIEVDGDSHLGGGAEQRDFRRQAFIESLWIRFLRCTNGNVCDNLAGVMDEILRVVRERLVRERVGRERAVHRKRRSHRERTTSPSPPADPPLPPRAKGGSGGVSRQANEALEREASSAGRSEGPPPR